MSHPLLGTRCHPPARRECFRSEPGPSLPTPHCCWSPWRETVLSLPLIPGRRMTSSSTMRGLARLCVRFGSPHARLPLRARTGARAGDQLARLSCSSACLNDLSTRFGGRGRFPLLCGVAEIAMPCGCTLIKPQVESSSQSGRSPYPGEATCRRSQQLFELKVSTLTLRTFHHAFARQLKSTMYTRTGNRNGCSTDP